MGKKVKKKGRLPHKEKMVASLSPKVVPKQSSRSVPTVVDGVSVIKERKLCVHLDKGVNLVKLSETIASTEPVRCKDCREAAADRRGSKGKGKHERKKGSGAMESKSDSKAIWVCLDCGHYACGGVGFPTTTQSHSVRHFKLTRHPLVMQFDNPHLCWCFPCNSLIPVKQSEENGEKKDTLFDIVKLIKGRSVEGASEDVEDVWFGGSSVKSEIISESSISSGIDGRGGYIVRGLVNLGNTCFFNSIMQNLLAMDRLRDYFLKLDGSVGPLAVALQKLFAETSPEAGSRNVITPKSFFGCVCSKSPQFRGFQQHDSHELLRCLLDGLCTEELGVRNQNSSKENGDSSGQVSTFVDAIFGGQISSTVCCMECGHSSTVYEQFLDLSLPVPTKKPPSKKAQPVSKGKKTKVPPKRAGRMRLKAKKEADLVSDQSVSKSSDASDSIQQVQCSVPDAENIVASGDSTWLDFISPSTTADDNGTVLYSLPATNELENKQVLENDLDGASVQLCDSAWLDYLEPETFTDDYEVTSQYNDTSGIREPRKEDVVHDGVLMHDNSSSSGQVCLPFMEPNLILNSSSRNSWEDEFPLQVQDSEVLLLPYKEESSTTGEKIEEGDASTVAVHGQESGDFDGFGDLFNEPEIYAGTSTNPLSGDSQENKVAETGFLAGNSSESADEVDNTDFPVSIESCLAYFTKPELLSNEHAWHCENCSKILRREKMKMKKNKGKITANFEMNGGGTSSQSYPLGSEKDLSCPTQVRNFNNGNIESDTDFNTSNESLLSQNGYVDSDQNCREPEIKQTDELNSVVFQREEAQAEMNADPTEVLASRCNPTGSQASSNYQSCDSCSLKSQHRDSKLLATECESEESQDGEVDSGSIKVKRDATKRFLIDKAPPILTIHLKRFSQDARGRLNKLNGHIGFRDTIDLMPFMDPRHKERERYNYRLLGVVEHAGTMRGGHYVAYVRGEKSTRKAEAENGSFVWYHASDAYVRQVSLEDVLRCEAYILFYEKI